MFKTVGLAAIAVVVALVVGFGARGSSVPAAHADTTDVSVIGCELLAGAVDGDTTNTITALDVQVACGADFPGTHVPNYGTELPSGFTLANCTVAATLAVPCAGVHGIPGTPSIKSLANAIGNEDGTLTKSDFNGADHFDENWDQNQISTDCTRAASSAAGALVAFGSGLACTLDVFTFVNHDQQTDIDLPAGLISIEALSQTATSGVGGITNPAVPLNLDFICLRDDRANEGKSTTITGTGNATPAATFAVTAASTANPTVISAAGHTYVNGNTVTISGNVGTATINGTFVVSSVVAGVSFTIPVNNLAGGTTVTAGAVVQGASTLGDSNITTTTSLGLSAGDVVTISGSSDLTANGQWLVSFASGTSVTLVGFTNTSVLTPGQTLIAATGTIVRDWAVGSDNDCNGGINTLGVPNNGDGVVMFHILEATASAGDVKTVNVTQDVVAQTFDVNVVGSPNQIALTLGEKVIETNVNSTNVGKCITDTKVTEGLAPPTSTVAWAVVTDKDNTVLTRIPVYFKVTPVEDTEMAKIGIGNAAEEVTSNTFFTIHPAITGLPTAAYTVICGGKETGSPTIDAAINLISCSLTGCSVLSSRDHDSQTLTVGGVPSSNVLTAEASAIKCDGTEKSTVTAKVTDSKGNNVANGVPVNFSVVALGTANPINTVTQDGKASSVITPLSNASAGVTVIVTAGDSGLATTVQTSVRVDCALALASQAPAPVATPRGGIGGPDTGNGGYLGQNGSSGLPMWTLIALVLGSVALVAGGMVTRRAGK